MLSAATPFPQTGAYALYLLGSELALVRIQHRHVGDRDGMALISFPRTFAASGSKTVPLADLVDGTPLDDAERAEMNRLAGDLARAKSGARGAKAKAARWVALKQRDIHAATMADKLRAAGLARAAA